MNALSRLLSLMIITGCFLVIHQATVRADPGCSTAEYQADCYAADDAAWFACQDACMRFYGLPIESYSGGSCHWYGENDPGNCWEDYPDTCGCFSGYTYGQCYCDGL